MKIFPARGMQDFLPAQKKHRDFVLNTIKNSYSKFGFQPIETPALENISIINSNQGGENEKLSFKVLKRGLTGDEPVKDAVDLALRYDLTLPLSRFYASNKSELPKIFKAMQIGPVWRAERPQAGRFRQFYQCDIDIIGCPDISAEVELILATVETLEKLGLKNPQVYLNDREIFQNIPSEALIILDKVDKLGTEKVGELLHENGFDKNIVTDIKNSKPTDNINQIIELIGGRVDIIFDPTLVRGMGYYTGPIFEIKLKESNLSVAGGGRYDNMIGKLSGENIPAVGFSIGFERIVDIVGNKQETNEAVAIIYNSADDFKAALKKQTEYHRQNITAGLIKAQKLNASFYDSLVKQGYTAALINDNLKTLKPDA